MFQTTNQKIIGTDGENLGTSPKSWENMGLSIENDDFPSVNMLELPIARLVLTAGQHFFEFSEAPEMRGEGQALSRAFLIKSILLGGFKHQWFMGMSIYICIYIWLIYGNYMVTDGY
jgi:hypothetical protein